MPNNEQIPTGLYSLKKENTKNPPAYPTIEEKHAGFNKMEMETTPGMALRDYFAAAALQGFTANIRWSEKLDISDDWDDYVQRLSAGAYECADAMLAVRSTSID